MASITQEAVDGGPVKQLVGAFPRIIALAEKADRSRQALYTLAERALDFCHAVPKVLDGRELDAILLQCPEKVFEEAICSMVQRVGSLHTMQRRQGRRALDGGTWCENPACAGTRGLNHGIPGGRATRVAASGCHSPPECKVSLVSINTNLRVHQANRVALDSARFDGESGFFGPARFIGTKRS